MISNPIVDGVTDGGPSVSTPGSTGRRTAQVPSLYDSFALYGSGVTLITVHDGAEDHAIVATSVLTASVNPFALAVSVGRLRPALVPMTSGKTWALAVVGAHQLDLVEQLAAPGTPGQRREHLLRAGAQRSAEGPLWLPDALVTFWCVTTSITPVNDQRLIIGEVTRASEHRGGTALVRWSHSYREIGN